MQTNSSPSSTPLVGASPTPRPADHHAFFAARITAPGEAIGKGSVESVEKVVRVGRITPGLTPGFASLMARSNWSRARRMKWAAPRCNSPQTESMRPEALELFERLNCIQHVG